MKHVSTEVKKRSEDRNDRNKETHLHVGLNRFRVEGGLGYKRSIPFSICSEGALIEI
jgi:hypothetical protein